MRFANTNTSECADQGHCVVFWGKTFNCHSTSLNPGVKMSTGELNAGGDPAMDYHSIEWGVETFLPILHATETGISSGMMSHLARM